MLLQKAWNIWIRWVGIDTNQDKTQRKANLKNFNTYCGRLSTRSIDYLMTHQPVMIKVLRIKNNALYMYLIFIIYNTYYIWFHRDVIKCKHFPRYWPFVGGIHGWPMDSPHKGQCRGAFMFSLNCAWKSCSANNRDDCDLRRHRTHYDVTVMYNFGYVMIHGRYRWPFTHIHPGSI